MLRMQIYESNSDAHKGLVTITEKMILKKKKIPGQIRNIIYQKILLRLQALK